MSSMSGTPFSVREKRSQASSSHLVSLAVMMEVRNDPRSYCPASLRLPMLWMSRSTMAQSSSRPPVLRGLK